VRTTLNLDDDAFALARNYAESRSLALGKAVSELVRRGLTTPVQTKEVNGFHVVVLPAGSPSVSSEDVKRLQDD
jgi:uncharacterized protein YbbK (DUF523 family)